MNLKQAIAGSVEKWRKLLAGEMRVWEAFDQCSLCDYTKDEGDFNWFHCSRCPLPAEGIECCDDDSPFMVMQDVWHALNELNELDGDDDRDINHPDIRPHAEAMYAALLDIQRQHEEGS